MAARNELRHLARRLASLSYEDRRRVIADAQRIEHEHYARVRMLASDASDAEVRCVDKPARDKRAAVI